MIVQSAESQLTLRIASPPELRVRRITIYSAFPFAWALVLPVVCCALWLGFTTYSISCERQPNQRPSCLIGYTAPGLPIFGDTFREVEALEFEDGSSSEQSRAWAHIRGKRYELPTPFGMNAAGYERLIPQAQRYLADPTRTSFEAESGLQWSCLGLGLLFALGAFGIPLANALAPYLHREPAFIEFNAQTQMARCYPGGYSSIQMRPLTLLTEVLIVDKHKLRFVFAGNYAVQVQNHPALAHDPQAQQQLEVTAREAMSWLWLRGYRPQLDERTTMPTGLP